MPAYQQLFCHNKANPLWISIYNNNKDNLFNRYLIAITY
jgi:hypothetical protein